MPIAIARNRRIDDYETAVRAAGGDPRLVDQTTPAAEVIAAAEGLLLAGGGDVDPALYGEAPHATFDAAEPGRDAYEIELIQRALDADLPILAICRGAQVLNVALGGTLVQDIRAELPQAIEHRFASPPNPAFLLAHTVTVTEGSTLAGALGDRAAHEPLEVNSRHHQAIKQPGDGLRVTAVAPDGVIEALEDSGRRFLLGVQWHPENFWRTGEFAALFQAFVRACRARP